MAVYQRAGTGTILVKPVFVFQLPVDNLKSCHYLFEKFEHSGIVIDSDTPGGHVYDVAKRTCRTNGSWKNTSPSRTKCRLAATRQRCGRIGMELRCPF